MTYLPHQDWNPVVFHKKPDTLSVKQAVRFGHKVETIQKQTGNGLQVSAKNRNLEADLYTDPSAEAPAQKPLPKLSIEDRQAMIKARTDKKLTQVQLAQQLNLRPNQIQDLENGKLIEDLGLLQKVNKVLGTRLRIQKN